MTIRLPFLFIILLLKINILLASSPEKLANPFLDNSYFAEMSLSKETVSHNILNIDSLSQICDLEISNFLSCKNKRMHRPICTLIRLCIIAALISLIFSFYYLLKLKTRDKKKLISIIRRNSLSVLATCFFSFLAYAVSQEFTEHKNEASIAKSSLIKTKKHNAQLSVNHILEELSFSDSYREDNHLELKSLQELALKKIKDSYKQIKDNNYLFVIDSSGQILSHPFYKNSIDLKEDWKAIFNQIYTKSKKSNGGFIEDLWPSKKLNSPQASSLTYIKEFAQWEWHVGVCIDDEDISKSLSQLQYRLRNKMYRHIFTVLVIGVFALALLLLAFNLLARKISDEVQELKSIFGKTELLIQPHSFLIDEFNSIAKGANDTFLALKRAHKETEKLYQAVEQSQVSVVITDKNGIIEYVNPKTCETTGYLKKELIGQNPRVLKSGAMNNEEYKNLWDTISSGKKWVGEFHNKRKNGQMYWEAATISAIRNKDNEVTSYVAVKEDITANKNMAAQLVHFQKLESVGQLAAGIAHEINTPTQYVLDNLSFLKDSIQSLFQNSQKYKDLVEQLSDETLQNDYLKAHKIAIDEMDLEYLLEELPNAIDESIEGASRISRIVKAMKSFSHPGQLERKSSNINEAIFSTMTVTRNEWKYIADFETDLDESLSPVPCYISELNQVFLNMIINARDAIQETGKKGKISIQTSQDDTHLIIRISDTGKGIPEDIKNKIFEPFFTTKEIGKGSGQGLAIAFDVIVKKHKGELLVDSVPDQGTSFTVKLPLT